MLLYYSYICVWAFFLSLSRQQKGESVYALCRSCTVLGWPDQAVVAVWPRFMTSCGCTEAAEETARGGLIQRLRPFSRICFAFWLTACFACFFCWSLRLFHGSFYTKSTKCCYYSIGAPWSGRRFVKAVQNMTSFFFVLFLIVSDVGSSFNWDMETEYQMNLLQNYLFFL